MKLRVSLIFLLSILSLHSHANMSSPYIEGDALSEAYSSKDIDILHEKLSIKLDGYFAHFTVVYTIQSDRVGRQIPLIFDTMNDKYSYRSNRRSEDSFKVWLDGEAISVKNIPSTYENPNALQWIDSLDFYLRYPKDDAPDLIGLKYFEVDLAEGKHTIRIEYTAEADIYLGGYLKELSFKYNLKPASFWRSFGGLDVTVDFSDIKGEFKINISGKDSILSEPVNNWHFDKLPKDEFVITYNPEVSLLARIMMAISPLGIVLVFFILLVALHVYLIGKYRKSHIAKRISPVVILGSILVPFFTLLIFVSSFGFIHMIIGEYASNRVGYIFLYFFLYPFLLIIYLPVMWIVDRNIKRKELAK